VRVFLTGHRGKIGSVVHRIVEEAGHEVVGFDLADGGDMLDAPAVEKAMAGCDAVAHLAMTLGRDLKEETFLEGGVMGTWNVLQAAERNSAQRVVSYSSVNAMGIFMGEDTPDFLPIDESHPCRPGRAYGTSKYLGEHLCRLFTRRTGVPTICIRPPAVLADHDIDRARESDSDSERTHHFEYGCFIHVEDLARATLCALTCPDPGHVVLLVNAADVASVKLSSRDLAREIHPEVEWRGGQEYDDEPFRALMDTSRARKVLDWEPQYRWRPL
jgi:nucleoside-diphosphate-sugar epimerase